MDETEIVIKLTREETELFKESFLDFVEAVREFSWDTKPSKAENLERKAQVLTHVIEEVF